MILEASGPLGTRDKARHMFDFVKGIFGCVTMLKAILRRFPSAHPSLLDKIRVIFLHTSAKSNKTDFSKLIYCKLTINFFDKIDDAIRLWLLKPAASGKFATF